jgi:hypothetical protein
MDTGPVTAVVTAVHRNGPQTVLRAAHGGSTTALAVAAAPDLDGARRRLRSARRIDRVDVVVAGSKVRAVMRGSRHRLPFAGPVPVAVALGLATLGVRTTVVQGAR